MRGGGGKASSLVDVPAEANASCDDVPAAANVTATDNCDAPPSVDLDEQSTQSANLESCAHYTYDITRTWTATDACGNSSSASQSIHVSDATVPSLTDVASEPNASCDDVPAAANVTATDNCDATPSVDLDEQSTQSANL